MDLDAALRQRAAGASGADSPPRRVDAATESSGNDSELEMDDVVSLGERADRVVHQLRVAFGTALASPVAWVQLRPSIAALREHKLRQVERGTATIRAVQRLRSPAMDALMQAASFMCEEDFYLVALPLGFWAGDYRLARRVTVLVVTGLFVGNVIKDVYQLPRPTNVWRPGLNLDSTGLADFGFPSTHAMNAVTNSLYLVWYHRDALRAAGPARLEAAAAASLAYVALVCASRLYLGAHTPTDVRGGLGLGAIVLAVFCGGAMERIEAAAAAAPPEAVALAWAPLAVALLLLNPQPRPPTPSFLQNALVVGLAWGLLAGASFADAEGLSGPNPPLSRWTAAKVAGGFAAVALVRVAVKGLATLLVTRALGIRVKPEVRVLTRRNRENPSRKARVVRLLTRDVDMIGVAVIKTLTYASIAFAITYGVPALARDVGPTVGAELARLVGV